MRPRVPTAAVTFVLGLALTACADGTGPPAASGAAATMAAALTVTSESFGAGGPMPATLSCDGDNRSPQLAWSGGPAGTAAFALIVDDPDANGFVHWLATDIPGSVSALPAGAVGQDAGIQGRNGSGGTGYTGPCPPSGTHRYRFQVVALSAPLRLAEGFAVDELRAAIADVELSSGTLEGTFSRGG